MKQTDKISLPIDSHLEEILEAVKEYSTIIVKASPGSGKTTRLPWVISEELNLKVAVLEPRRLAAKLAAKRIAEENHLKLGDEIGYHFRFEKNYSEKSNVIFYTEGTFLKKFLNDHEINHFNVIIIDEFHERHLETDLALALLRSLQLKRDIKIVLMSATIETDIHKLFNHSKVIEISSIQYPVEIRYLLNQPSILNAPIEVKVKRSIDETNGDTLVFLPGMREMLKVKEILNPNFNVLLLHSELSKEEQNKALLPCKERKIILSTNIAESSVTIPGISTVIDSGIQRESWYSPWNGLKYIQDVPVTKSSAIQRAGRAGRTGPGVCIRLYSEFDFNERKNNAIPEIERADLTDICLFVFGTGTNPMWPKEPDKGKWEKAIELLEKLGALHLKNITPLGRKMLEYPVDARIARVLISGEKLSFKSKEKLLKYICREIEKDHSDILFKRLQFYLKATDGEETNWKKSLIYGFIDQLARYRPHQKDFIHYSGKILKVHKGLDQLSEGFYLIFNISQREEATEVLSIDEEWFWDIDPFPIKEEFDFDIDDKILIIHKTKIGRIVLEEQIVKKDWDEVESHLKKKMLPVLNNISQKKIEQIKFDSKFERLHFWAIIKKVDINSLISLFQVEDYLNLYPQMNWENFNVFFFSQLEKNLEIDEIDKQLPTKIKLKGNKDIIVHYPIGLEPFIEAPIQDFYGTEETPKILLGAIPLTLKLLGPHKRPIQITKDLKSFWHKTYKDLKKEYEREYPKHYWPEHPWKEKPYLLKSHLAKA